MRVVCELGGVGGGDLTPSSLCPFRAIIPVGKGARTAKKTLPLMTLPVSLLTKARGIKEEEIDNHAVKVEKAGRDGQDKAEDNPRPSEAASE